MTDPTGGWQPVPAVSRAVKILRVIAERPSGATLDEVTRALGFPKSSTLSICRTLVAEDLLRRDAAGRYRTSLGMVELAHRALQEQSLVVAFNEILDAESIALPGTVQLAVGRGTEVLYLSQYHVDAAVTLSSSVGGRLPASTTAVGRCLLAARPDQELRDLYKGVILPQSTTASIRTFRGLLNDLTIVRENGFAVDDEATMEGIICVAAALPATETTEPAAISITSLKTLAAVEALEHTAQLTMMLASKIGKWLGVMPHSQSLSG